MNHYRSYLKWRKWWILNARTRTCTYKCTYNRVVHCAICNCLVWSFWNLLSNMGCAQNTNRERERQRSLYRCFYSAAFIGGLWTNPIWALGTQASLRRGAVPVVSRSILPDLGPHIQTDGGETNIETLETMADKYIPSGNLTYIAIESGHLIAIYSECFPLQQGDFA